AKRRQLALGDDQQAGSGLAGGGGEVVTVEPVAFDGEERLARLQRGRVDRDGGHPRWRRADRPSGHRLDKRLAPPQVGQAACFRSAARTSSWSEKGSVTVPTVWPSSWPLPATISVSPGRSIATASRIACRRSPISIAPGAAAMIAARMSDGSSERG